MSDMFKLVLALGQAAGARSGRRLLARAATSAALGAVALICIIAALGCAIAALWIYLAPLLGPAGAPLVVGGALLSIAVLVAIVMRYGIGASRRSRPGNDASSLLLAETQRLLKDHKGSVLTGAILAGLVAGLTRR